MLKLRSRRPEEPAAGGVTTVGEGGENGIDGVI